MDKGVSPICLGMFSVVLVTYLLIFWHVDYSVYLSPFNPMDLDFASLGIYVYRFCLGFFGSLFIILIAKWIVQWSFFKSLSKLGKYTLVMYTVSIICKYIIHNSTQLLIDRPMYLEVASFMATVLLIAISVGLTKLFEKNKFISIIFLGQNN